MNHTLGNRFPRSIVTVVMVMSMLTLTLNAAAQPPQPQVEVTGDDALNQGPIGEARSNRGEQDEANVEGVEYLTRGPLHEAFANPYDENPTPNPVITQEPPEPIDEVPPEYRPTGDNINWIPGYWSWDDERNDFIWISGVWRDIPPGQQWVPGYWDRANDGFQYVDGFWANETTAEVEYLPAPPQSLEQGPASPSPGDDHFYVPGNWVYQSSDYQWQPGYWSAAQPNWVWVPAQYIWTPRGCVFQDGYWDFDVAYRGVVFTPVYYQQPIYRQPRFSYRPRYTIDTGVSLFVNLFIRPNYGRYYFGDYYGSQYSNRYYPWVTRSQGYRHYDPFFAAYNQRGRFGNDNYIRWITNQHQIFANNDRFRPPRTISAQQAFLRNLEQGDLRDERIDPTTLRLTSIGESLQNLATSNDGDIKFQRLAQEEIDRVRSATEPMRQISRDRLDIEGAIATARDNPNRGRESGSEANVDVDAKARADQDATSRTESGAEVDVENTVPQDRKDRPTDADSPRDSTQPRNAAQPRDANRAENGNRARRLRLPGVNSNQPRPADALNPNRQENGQAADRRESPRRNNAPPNNARTDDRDANLNLNRDTAMPNLDRATTDPLRDSQKALQGNGRQDDARKDSNRQETNRQSQAQQQIESTLRSSREAQLRPNRPEGFPTMTRPDRNRQLPNRPGGSPTTIPRTGVDNGNPETRQRPEAIGQPRANAPSQPGAGAPGNAGRSGGGDAAPANQRPRASGNAPRSNPGHSGVGDRPGKGGGSGAAKKAGGAAKSAKKAGGD